MRRKWPSNALDPGAQRLVSWTRSLRWARPERRAQGEPADEPLLALAAELREFEMPQPLFTNARKGRMSAGRYEIRHTQTQMRTA